MHLSLRTKFYLHLLPLGIIFPVLLYSLALPYSQMREVFYRFQIDTDRAVAAQQLSKLVAIKQVELLQSIAEKQEAVVRERVNEQNHQTNYLAIEKKTADIINSLKTESKVDTYESQEEKEIALIKDIEILDQKFSQIATRAIEQINVGQVDQALQIIEDELGPLVETELEPKIEQLRVIESQSVTQNLPVLISIIDRFGVIPIPGIQAKITESNDNLNDALEANELAEIIVYQEVGLFKELDDEETSSSTTSNDSEYQENRSKAGAMINDFKMAEATEDEPDNGRMRLLGEIERTYGVFNQQSDYLLALARENKTDQAIVEISGTIDEVMTASLLPAIEAFANLEESRRLTTISNLDKNMSQIVIFSWLICGLIFLVGLVSVWRLSQIIIKPIILLRDAMLRVSGGSYLEKIVVDRNDEIGELAQTFNTMARKVNEAHLTLEQRVAERTDKLATQMQEVERLNKFMTGRELEMVKLKEEIEKLERQK